MTITMDTDSSGIEMASDNGVIGSSVSPISRIAITGPVAVAIAISWVAIPIAISRVAVTVG